MITIGIHFGHDSSLAIIENGEIVLSVEEERFTRVKTYRGFPYGALEYAKNSFNIELKHADLIVISGTDILDELSLDSIKERFENLNYKKKFFKIKNKLIKIDTSLKVKEEYFYEKMAELGVDKKKIVFKNHHLLHASSAYFQSPFEDCLIVTSDGKGDDISSAIYTFENNEFKLHSSIGALSSIGQLYSAVTMYLGFKPNRHEGKITGLAAYGKSNKLSSKLLELFEFDNVKGVYVSKFENEVKIKSLNDIFKDFNHDIIKYENIKNIKYEIGRQYETIFALYLQYFDDIFSNETKEDIAAAVQFTLEKIVVQYITYWSKKLDKKYICMAGGVFANVKLNQRVLAIDGVENIFVQPAMGDSGLSIGGALLAESEILKKNTRKTIDTVYKGPEFSNSEIALKLEQANLKFQEFDSEKDQAKEIAQLLVNNNLIGLFNGRMEYGPRALGTRTVMMSPSDKSINDTANKRFNRTEFMPFAPVIIDKYAKDYFIGYKEDHIAAEFMTVTYDVFPEKVNEIEAVVHVDNTARPQVIKRDKNPLYYSILEEFYKISGIPVTVNTSFNAHEEPILHNIDNAINALNNNIIDYLSIGNFLVKSKIAVYE